MVKFADPSFQDAYLSSPPPRSRKQYNANNNNNNSYRSTAAGTCSPATPNSRGVEEYTSPLLQRSQARTMERQSCTKEYKATSMPASRQRENRKDKDPSSSSTSSAKHVAIGTTPRTQKLRDLSSPVSDDKEAHDDTPNHFSDLDYGQVTATSNIGTSTNDYGRDSTKVWDADASHIRRELCRDITKQVKSDISEMEEFAQGMRRRIQHYSYSLRTRVVVDVDDDSGGGVDGGRAAAGRDGNDKRWGRDDHSAEDEHTSMGIVLQLKKTLSNEDILPMATKARTPTKPMDDDGYGKQVRSGKKKDDTGARAKGGDTNSDIGSLLYKFQHTQNKHSSAMKTTDDELIKISSERNRDHQNATILSKQDQARKMDDEDDSRDSEVYFATSSSGISGKHGNETNSTSYYASSSPRDAMLQQIRELKKKQVEDHEQSSPPTTLSSPSPPAKEERRSERKQHVKAESEDLDDWWNEHKQQQQPVEQSRDERLESWRRVQRSKMKINGLERATLFEEPSGEPTIDDDVPSSVRKRGDVKDTPAVSPLLKSQLSPSSKTPTRSTPTRMRNESPTRSCKESSAASSTSSDLASYRSRHSKSDTLNSNSSSRTHGSNYECDTLNNKSSSSSRRSKNTTSPNPSRRQAVGPPCPEGKTSPRGKTSLSSSRTSKDGALATRATRNTSSHDNATTTTNNKNSNAVTTSKNATSPNPSSQRRAVGPPCPEVMTSPRGKTSSNSSHTSKDGALATRATRNTSAHHNAITTDNNNSNNDGTTSRHNTSNNEEQSPQPPSSILGNSVFPKHSNQDTSSATASVMSDGDSQRCQSVAQSTLSILLSRIEDAKSNFTKALVDGDVEKQAELAGLMTRLGEAAVTMRKLEQI